MKHSIIANDGDKIPVGMEWEACRICGTQFFTKRNSQIWLWIVNTFFDIYRLFLPKKYRIPRHSKITGIAKCPKCGNKIWHGEFSDT